MNAGRATRWYRMVGKAPIGSSGWTSTRQRRPAIRSMGGLVALTLALATACTTGSGPNKLAPSASGNTKVSPDYSSQGPIVYVPCCGLPGLDQNPQANRAEHYRPRTIAFDATGSQVLQNATWQVWNAREAIAAGTAAINSCEPGCAGGRYYKDPVIVALSEPQECDGSWFWSKAVWHFPDGIPPSETQNRTMSILFGC